MRPTGSARRTRARDAVIEMQMGPMIDMVFLLLVFFMVTARPTPDEADLSVTLPGTVPQDEVLELPDEQRIIVRADGTVVLNELELGAPGDGELDGLVTTLTRFRLASEAAGSRAFVTLDPDDAVPHQRVMDVMNACARAELHEVSFAEKDES